MGICSRRKADATGEDWGIFSPSNLFLSRSWWHFTEFSPKPSMRVLPCLQAR